YQIEHERENLNKLWAYILQRKYEDIADEELLRELVERGYSIEDVTPVVSSIGKVTAELLEDAKAAQITGILILIAGITAACLFPHFEPENLISRFWITMMPYLVIG